MFYLAPSREKVEAPPIPPFSAADDGCLFALRRTDFALVWCSISIPVFNRRDGA
jgi:hypothetical protein